MAGALGAVLALLAPPQPFATLRLAAAGLLGAALAVALAWRHPRAPLAGGALLVLGLAVAPPMSSLLWGLAVAVPSLVALAAAQAERAGEIAHAAGALVAVLAAAVALVLLLGGVLPRLSPGSGPLALLVAGLVVLGLATLVLLLRHRGDDTPAA